MNKGSVLEKKENINLCYSATAILDTQIDWMTDSFPVLVSLVLSF